MSLLSGGSVTTSRNKGISAGPDLENGGIMIFAI